MAKKLKGPFLSETISSDERARLLEQQAQLSCAFVKVLEQYEASALTALVAGLHVAVIAAGHIQMKREDVLRVYDGVVEEVFDRRRTESN